MLLKTLYMAGKIQKYFLSKCAMDRVPMVNKK